MKLAIEISKHLGNWVRNQPIDQHCRIQRNGPTVAHPAHYILNIDRGEQSRLCIRQIRWGRLPDTNITISREVEASGTLYFRIAPSCFATEKLVAKTIEPHLHNLFVVNNYPSMQEMILSIDRHCHNCVAPLPTFSGTLKQMELIIEQLAEAHNKKINDDADRTGTDSRGVTAIDIN